MSSENFYDDWVINTKKPKNKFPDERFILSEYSKDGCNYCLQSKCNVHNGEKAKHIHPLIRKVIRNPSIIVGDPKKLLTENGISMGDKHIHVNTCVWNYTHEAGCQNCNAGRFKFIKWKNHKGEEIDLKFCVPLLKENSNVIPIGFHWNVDITVKNNEIIYDDLKIKMHDGFKVEEPAESNDLTNIDINVNENENKLIKHEIIESNHLKPDNVWSNIKETNIKNKLDDSEIIPNQENVLLKSNYLNNKKEDDSIVIQRLTKENSLLFKENNVQKNEIKSLRSLVNKKADDYIIKKNLQEAQITIDEKNKKIIDLEKILSNIKNTSSSKSNSFSEIDRKNIEKSMKYFSNVLFNSFIENHYTV